MLFIIGWVLLALLGDVQAQTCVPDPANGICCKPAPCNTPEGFVNYETKRIVDGALCGNDSYGLVCADTIVLRRLGLPTNAAEPNHYAIWETASGPALGGVDFTAQTALGRVTARLTRFRFFITQDTAKSFIAQPPPVMLSKLWDCYGTDNVRVTDAQGETIGRQPVGWVDQIGPHDASVGQPSMVCVPGNGSTTETFVCYGTMRNYGQVPTDKKYPWVSVPPEAAGTATGQLGQVEIKPPHEFCVSATVLP